MRNDDDWIEGWNIAFAMYCDENGLTLDEGRRLASDAGMELEVVAEDRASYLPEGDL